MNPFLARLLRESAEVVPVVKVGDQPIELFEYVALKQEQATRISLRETALYANLAVSASLLAVYFESARPDIRVLLLLPYFSVIMFWIYWNNDYYISAIGRYVSNYLAPRIALHLQDLDQQTNSRAPHFIFAWEHTHKAFSLSRIVRRVLGIFIFFLSFVAVPAIALAILALQPQMTGLALWAWYAGVAITLGLLVGFVLSGVPS